MGRLADIIKSELGFMFQAEFTPLAEALAADTIEQLLKANPDRVRWTIFNLGTEVAYLSHGADPSSTNGYYLDKNGGMLSMNWHDDGELVGYPIYAISAGTPTLYISAVRAV